MERGGDPPIDRSSSARSGSAPASIALTMRLPHDPAGIALVRHVARQSLAAIGVTPDVVDDIELALSEACTNVLRHAGPGENYEVAVLVNGYHCEVRVTDGGRGFDHAAVRRQLPDRHAERGRGLAIMEAVMDRVELESRPDRGTVVTMVKQLTFDRGSWARAVRGSMPTERPRPAPATPEPGG